MLKKIKVESAVGTKLTHDITEIRPGEFKGPAFRNGHEICSEDICHLQKLEKNHLYLIDLESDEIHEDQAACVKIARIVPIPIAHLERANDSFLKKEQTNPGHASYPIVTCPQFYTTL